MSMDDAVVRLLLTDEERENLPPGFQNRLLVLLDEVNRRVQSEEKVRWIMEKPERIEAFLDE